MPDDDLEARLAEVSEGELSLLARAPDRPAHHHRNKISITAQSLRDGWVGLEQCHSQLDAVAETQIVYLPQRIRNIRILSAENIDAHRVEGPTVQLQGIGHDARLCLRAESQALHRLDADHYRLKNGPYMRRFLDGYYPMRVSLEISYPENRLSLQGFRPPPGGAGRFEQRTGHLLWDSWFKGRLFTEFDFILQRQP